MMTLVVAVIGFRGVLAGYPASVTFPKWLLAKAWGQLLAGGVFFLLLEGWVAYCVFWGKRVPWVLVVFAWIGVYGMLWSARGSYHEISHAMFESCTGYSDFVFEMAVGIASLITVVWLLEFRLQRGVGGAGLKLISGVRMTPNLWRVCGLLAIAVCWLGTLWFYGVI